MKRLVCTWALVMAMAVMGRGEENSAQRLEKAQQGMAEASWPKKPDNRLSPLSGKMKDTAKISPRFYGQDQEFPARRLGEWQKESRLAAVAKWDGASGRAWEEARWNQSRVSSESGQMHHEFVPASEWVQEGDRSYREVQKVTAPDWSSRTSRLGGTSDGLLRRYEGRLTRVRSQVRDDGPSGRDLGTGRREQFRPEEVEKILSQPVGEFREAATGRSPSAFPLAAADN